MRWVVCDMGECVCDGGCRLDGSVCVLVSG